MKKGNTMFHISQEQGDISVIADSKDTDYFKTVLYEALVELGKSVESIKSVTNPEKLKELVTPKDNKPQIKGKATFDLMKYLSSDRMITDLQSTDKESVIRELVQKAVTIGAISEDNFESVFYEVSEREKSMSTGLGNEVAVPHCKSEFVKDNVILIALKPNGIDFDAIDNKPVKIFVLIISPKNDAGPHLQVLAALSRLLSNGDIRDGLLKSNDADELYNKIKLALKS
jgi:fructose-specific phosphotransferase system IIA component